MKSRAPLVIIYTCCIVTGLLKHRVLSLRVFDSLVWMNFIENFIRILFENSIPGYLENTKNTKLRHALQHIELTKAQKQPKCPSTDSWIKKNVSVCVCVWVCVCACVRMHMYLLEYYSAINNEILPFVATWMDLENVMLGEVKSYRQTNTIRYHFYVESKK